MRVELLPRALAAGDGPTIVCAQVGNVNTGSCDDVTAIADAVEGTGAWLHVDGAFGLWAAASPRLPPPRRRRRARGLVGDGRAQVAERALRLRHRLLRRSGGAPRGDVACGRAISSRPTPTRRGIRWTGTRSSRVARAASRSTRRSARSGATGSPRWSSAAATTRRRFAELLGAEPDVEILNDVVLNQVLVRFGDDDELHAGDGRGACRRTGPAGSPARSGRARRRCGSRSRTGGRPTTTSSARPARSWRRPRGSPAPSSHVSDVHDLFRLTADYAAQFHDTLDERPVHAAGDASTSCVEALGGAAAGRGRARTSRSSRS